MKTEQALLIGLAVGVVALAAAYEFGSAAPDSKRKEITPESLKIGMTNPPLWIFYNDSEVNSRHWYDFGARSGRAINLPLLNTLYERIVLKNGKEYRVEVLGGLTGVAERLGGWEAMPATLRNPKAKVAQAEEDWIRTAILAKYGGLWLSPSVVALKGFGKLPADKVVAFGQDDVPMYGSAVPGFRALWAPSPNLPMFIEWEKRCRNRLEVQLGGRQIRGDAKGDWVELCLSHGGGCEVRPFCELGRNPKTNKKLELEDLFAAGTQGRLPFEIPSEAVYLVVPYEDLLNRRQFGWILRSSEDQIMSSDLALRYILELA
jgi:hypothetical protein